MKILFLLHSTSLAEGSVRSFRALAEGLCAEGAELTVVAPDGEGVCRELAEMPVTVVTMPIHLDIYPVLNRRLNYVCFLPFLCWAVLCNALCYQRLKRLVRKWQPDIIHSNTGMLRLGFYVARRYGIPHVYHLREYGDRDFSMHHFPSKGAFQRTLRSPLCYDISITRAIQHYHGRSANPRSRVIYNGIRSARETTEPHEVGSYFLYVGRIEPQKGFLLLAEAYADYFVKAANPLPLKVAGAIADKHYRQQADALFQRCGAQTLVTYLGQRDDIPTLMREARALVVTSQNEAFGRVMPEAMFAGCPVIACDKAGTHEQLQNGLSQQGADIALPFTTADELTSHLLTATLSPESLTPMAARALSTVRLLYTWECNVAATMDFYNEIINHKKTP